MKFFPTQIDTWRTCPLKYWYGRDPAIRAKYSRSSPHLVLGNAVHDALQGFFDLSRVRVEERTYERLCALLREAWGGTGAFKRNLHKQREAREQAFGGDRAQEKAWGEKALHVLWRYFQTRPADRTAVPLTAEQFHEVWLTEHVTLGGKIDRIDRREDGGLEILDYKTGKPPGRRPSEEDLARDDLQLAAYALLVTRKFRGRVVRCSYLYLDDDLELGYTPDPEGLARKEAEIVEVCGRILANWSALEGGRAPEQAFEPRPNVLCGWCDFREICPCGDEWERSHGSPASAEPVDLPF